MTPFNGLGLHLGNLSRLSSARSRSISPENFTGEKGAGGMSTDGPAAQMARGLGQGWKVSPFVVIAPGEERLLADIDGPGAIQQVWMTLARGRRRHRGEYRPPCTEGDSRAETGRGSRLRHRGRR